MIQGTFCFDGLALGRLEIDTTRTPLEVTAKFAFVDTKTGKTHGWTTYNGPLPPSALESFKAFAAALEGAVIQRHAEHASVSMPMQKEDPQKKDEGLDDFLGNVDDPL
jgi:hypothetical protein